MTFHTYPDEPVPDDVLATAVSCPLCDRPSTVAECAACGRGVDPLLGTMIQVDNEIAAAQDEQSAAREQLARIDERIDTLYRRRRDISQTLKSRRRDAKAKAPAAQAVSTPPAAIVPAPGAPVPPATPLPAPAEPVSPPPVLVASTAPEIEAAQRSETSARSIQNVLLTLGAILSATAIIVFTAVAWATFGSGGRAIILTTITAAMLAVPLWLRRRGLRATAETLSGLAIVMVPCDAVAVYFLDVFGVAGPDPTTLVDPADQPGIRDLFHIGFDLAPPGYFALAVAVIALGYRRVTRMLVPGYAAVTATGIALLLLCAQPQPLHGAIGTSLVAGLAALTTRLCRRFPTGYGSSADRILIETGAAISALAVIALPVHTLGHLAPRYLLPVSLAMVVAVLAVGRRLPDGVRRGPSIVGYPAAAAGSIATAVLFGSTVALAWAESTPVWTADVAVPDWPFDPGSSLGWPVTVSLAWCGVLAWRAVTSPAARATHLAVTGGAITLSLPSTVGLPWPFAAILIGAAAVAAALLSVRTRYPAPVFVAAVLGADAIAVSEGGPVTILIVLAGMSAGFTLTARTAWRRRRWGHSGLWTGAAGCLAVAAFPVALHLCAASTIHIALLTPVAAALPVAIAAFGVAYRPVPSARLRMFVRRMSIGLVGAAGVGYAVPTVLIAIRDVPPVGLVSAAAVLVGFWFAVRDFIAPDQSRPELVVTAAAATLVTAVSGYLAIISPPDGLAGYVITSIVAIMLASGLPSRVAAPAARGGMLVGAAAAAIVAAAAVSSVGPALDLFPPFIWLDWRTPLVLAVTALAAATLLHQPWRWNITIAGAGLAILAAPVCWELPWWTAGVLSAATATGIALWSVFRARADGAAGWLAAAGATAGYSLAVSLFASERPGHQAAAALAAGVGFALSAGGGLTAWTAHRRRRAVGGVALTFALVCLPFSVLSTGIALDWTPDQIRLACMGTACTALLVAALLRAARSPYLRWATIVVPSLTSVCAHAGPSSPHTPMLIAVAGLVGVCGAMLMLPHRVPAMIRIGLSSVSIVSAWVHVIGIPASALAAPYRQLGAVWHDVPVTVGTGFTGTDLIILTIATTAVGLAGFGLAGTRWARSIIATAAVLLLPSAVVVYAPPWPVLPFSCIGIGLTTFLITAHRRRPTRYCAVDGTVALIATTSGLAGALATSAATITALVAISAACGWVAWRGDGPGRRATGWILSSLALSGLAAALGFAAGLPATQTAIGVAMVAVGFLALAAVRPPVTADVRWATEVGGHLAIAAAIGLAAGSRGLLAVVLVIYGAVLGLLAVRAPDVPDGTTTARRRYAAGSALAAFGAYWLLLADVHVSVIELYTAPFALLTMVGGWLEWRRRPGLRSWIAYGPGLLLGLLPSLAQVLFSTDDPARRLLLGAAALTVLLLGSWQRLKAPVLTGSVVLVLLAGHELMLYWTRVPSWAPLALVGGVLLVLGATFENRRRDLRRLRATVGAMR